MWCLLFNLFKIYFPQVGNIYVLEVIGSSTWNNLGKLLGTGPDIFKMAH